MIAPEVGSRRISKPSALWGLICEGSLYVHASDGVPGVDVGSGWSWSGTLVLDDAVLDFDATFPLRISTGSLRVDDDAFENLIPLPLDRSGVVAVHVRSADRDSVVKARGPRFRRRAQPIRYRAMIFGGTSSPAVIAHE